MFTAAIFKLAETCQMCQAIQRHSCSEN